MASYIPNVTDKFADPALYTPNFGFLDTMLRRRQGMYDQGFAQVNQQYATLSREVTNGANAETRDQYLQTAQKQLKDLSSLDLSQQQNVQNAVNVFQPFYKDQRLLGDMALTAHWNQQESIAESFRLKDGGKEFSQENLDYVRMQKAQFANDKAENWKGYYANRASYTPYYDYQTEVRTLMDKYKPNSVPLMQQNGMYIFTTQDNSTYPKDVKRYLDGTLSDKAKQQMKIEAVVRLSKDPIALANSFTELANDRLGSLNLEIADTESKLKMTKKEDEIKQLAAMKERAIGEKEDISSTLKNIAGGNMEFITTNQEKLALQVYNNKKMKDWSLAYARQDMVKDIKFDQVAMMIYQEGQQNARARERMAFDREMKMLELNGSGVPVPGQLPSDPGDVFDKSLGTVQKSIAETNGSMSALNEQLKDHMAQVNPKLTRNKISDTDVQNFLAKAKETKDNWVLEKYYPQIATLKTRLDSYNNEVATAEKEATKGMSKAELDNIASLKADIGQIPSVQVYANGGMHTISADDVFDALVNKRTGVSRVGSRGGGTNLTVDIKGQTFSGMATGPTANKSISDLDVLIHSVENFNLRNKDRIGAYTKYNKEITGYFDQKKTLTHDVLNFGDDSKVTKNTKSYLEGIVPREYAATVSNVLVDPGQNRVYFNLTAGADKKPDNETVVSQLTARGQKAGYNKAAGLYYIESSNIPNTNFTGNLNSQEMEIFKVGQNAGRNYHSVIWFPNGHFDDKGSPQSGFRFEKLVDAAGQSSYYLYAEGNPQAVRNKKYEDLYSLMLDARKLAANPTALAALQNP